MTAGDPFRLLVVSPVRNEAEHLPALVRSMRAQTRQPDSWLIVDDGSTDETRRIAEEAAQTLPFLRVVVAPAGGAESVGRRLDDAAEAVAFNYGLGVAEWQHFNAIGKLDGDIELHPDHFEKLLAALVSDPQLGIVGSPLMEESGGQWKELPVPGYHVHGAVKLYRRSCLEAIGGVRERLGWDTIDQTLARMRGFSTRNVEGVPGRHLRPWGSAGGRLRGCARYGVCGYIVGYGPLWMALRSLKVARRSPVVLSGVWFYVGYLWAVADREVSPCDEPGFVAFTRRELRRRLAARAN